MRESGDRWRIGVEVRPGRVSVVFAAEHAIRQRQRLAHVLRRDIDRDRDPVSGHEVTAVSDIDVKDAGKGSAASRDAARQAGHRYRKGAG